MTLHRGDNLPILIVGGGIGGLALAQGLGRAGVDFKVFERDAEPRSRLQGYRLSLTPDGLRGLHQLLPDERWREVLASCTPPLPGISFLSQRLEQRFFKPTPPTEGDERYSSIGRAPLRDILLRGVEDAVEFGHPVRDVEAGDQGDVACVFADGSKVRGSLLVGADGNKSTMRTSLLPESNRYDTGVSAIAGRVPAHDERAARIIAPPVGDSAVILGDAPQGLFIANHQLSGGPSDGNYVFWSFLTRRERLPDDAARFSPGRLLELVDTMTEGWHPRLKELVHGAVPDSVLMLDYASSRRPAPWKSDRVALIGDAIHNMPPTGGEGANMALKDAANLCGMLVGRDTSEYPAILTAYQDQMRAYAFDAVDRAMKNLERIVTRAESPS